MQETSKTKKLWSEKEFSYLQGKGIDIGCGDDPVFPHVFAFDLEQGDANEISKYVKDTFDFVFSSHCLEHMIDPKKTLHDWWKLVKPGGFLFFIVPDEDLYEQGIFPSQYNTDHKATFTISKRKSWSPVSHNVWDLAHSLPSGEIVGLELQDNGYQRKLITFGKRTPSNIVTRLLNKPRFIKQSVFGRMFWGFDQLTSPDVTAQIQCVVRKNIHPHDQS